MDDRYETTTEYARHAGAFWSMGPPVLPFLHSAGCGMFYRSREITFLRANAHISPLWYFYYYSSLFWAAITRFILPGTG